MVQRGDRLTYKGESGWRAVSPAPHVGRGWWRIRRRREGPLAAFVGRVAHEGAFTVQPLELEPGQEVRVGEARRRATVVEFLPGRVVRVEYPAEKRVSAALKVPWLRDAGPGDVPPDLIDI